jgi:hypothetical protein
MEILDLKVEPVERDWKPQWQDAPQAIQSVQRPSQAPGKAAL